MSIFATAAEIASIIATNPWSCVLYHNDGTSEDEFNAFLAKWGRSGGVPWDQVYILSGLNRYVLLAQPDSPIAKRGELIKATKGAITKALNVLHCEILDWKVEYTCEELT